MADDGYTDGAKKRLVEAKNDLTREQQSNPNPIIDILKATLDKLLTLVGLPGFLAYMRAWAMVILCVVLLLGISVVAAVAVLAVYSHNRTPYMSVSDAQLGALQYGAQDGTIQYLQMSITILANNVKTKADATFSQVDLALQLHGVDVALLRSPAFVVPPQSSMPLQYNVVSTGRALGPAGMRSMEESLEAGVAPLDLHGKERTRWKGGGVFHRAHFWTRISCRLRFFFPGNGTVMPADRRRCRSR